jgi:hypothetical protein
LSQLKKLTLTPDEDPLEYTTLAALLHFSPMRCGKAGCAMNGLFKAK